jgi:hypothetical protein
MTSEPPDAARAVLVERLREAVGRLDSATDCLSCAQAAVALDSRECAEVIMERIRKIASSDTRFSVRPEFLVIRDLAMALRTIHDGFGDLS